jgi:phosphatidylglycerol:prolipoprotein diacylglycerol transferase
MGGQLPRHPSQLYEAVLEGPVLFGVLWWLRKKTSKNGVILGLFLSGYGLSRFIVEFFREPDPQLGFVLMSLTMGQVLCIYMILGGLLLLSYCATRRNSSPDGHQNREVKREGNP